MSKFYTASGQSFTLGSSISSTATSILLTSFKVPVTGTDITMATMNTSVAYGTLAPGTSQAELISFTGVTQNADGTATLTGVTRGLNKEYPYTESSSFKQPHAGQTIFILSDAPQVFNQYPAKVNTENITGQWTFPQGGTASAPLVGASYAAPVQNNEVATKKYVDDTAISGSPDATTAVKGIIQLPTGAQSKSGTATGSTGATLVVTNNQYGSRYNLGYVATAGSVNAYTATLTPTPTSLATGDIVGLNITTANTGNATLNVDSLGAKDIFLGGTGLLAGALATNMVVGVQYDGTQFNVITRTQGESASATASKLALRNSTGDVTVNTTPTASTDAASKAYADSLVISYKSGTTTKNAADASTTQNIAHGLGKTPKYARILALASQSGASSGDMNTLYAETVYNGTTQSSISVYRQSTNNQTQATTFTLNGAGTDSATQTGVLTWDSTNLIITWTKTGSPTGTYNILWEAEG